MHTFIPCSPRSSFLGVISLSVRRHASFHGPISSAVPYHILFSFGVVISQGIKLASLLVVYVALEVSLFSPSRYFFHGFLSLTFSNLF